MDPSANFRGQLLRAVALPPAVLCLLSAIFFSLILHLLAVIELVGETDRLIARAYRTSQLLGDMEAGLRAYLDARSPASLRTYREAQGRIGGSLEELTRLVAADPDQSQRLATIRQRGDRWVGLAGKLIALRDATPGRYLDPQAGAPASALMEEIRGRMAAFLDAEEGNRDRRSDAAQSRSWSVLAACSGLAITLGILLAYSSRRHLVAIRRSFEAAMEDMRAQADHQERENLDLLSEAMKYYAIFSLDTEGRITSWNEDAERIMGYRSEDVMNRRYTCFRGGDLGKGVTLEDLDWAAREGRVEDERWLTRKDGFRFRARVAFVALRDPDGTLRGFTNVIHEIEDQAK